MIFDFYSVPFAAYGAPPLHKSCGRRTDRRAERSAYAVVALAAGYEDCAYSGVRQNPAGLEEIFEVNRIHVEDKDRARHSAPRCDQVFGDRADDGRAERVEQIDDQRLVGKNILRGIAADQFDPAVVGGCRCKPRDICFCRFDEFAGKLHSGDAPERQLRRKDQGAPLPGAKINKPVRREVDLEFCEKVSELVGIGGDVAEAVSPVVSGNCVSEDFLHATGLNSVLPIELFVHSGFLREPFGVRRIVRTEQAPHPVLDARRDRRRSEIAIDGPDPAKPSSYCKHSYFPTDITVCRGTQ